MKPARCRCAAVGGAVRAAPRPPAPRPTLYTPTPPHIRPPPQVRLLEGFVVLGVVAAAVGSGVAMLHAVDTPSRWAAPPRTGAD